MAKGSHFQTMYSFGGYMSTPAWDAGYPNSIGPWSHRQCGDAQQVMQSLLAWLDKVHPGPGAATLEEFAQRADDLELQALAAGLKEELYGKSEGDESYPPWQAVDFYNSVAKARKRLLNEKKAQVKPIGLQPLNP